MLLKIMHLIDRIMGKKCKYWKACEYYSEDSVTCNKTAGVYARLGKYAGCYYRNEENATKFKMHRKSIT